MSTLSERLKAAFDDKSHSYAALARAAKVKPPSVFEWFSGETKSLKSEPLVRAARYLGVNAFWLATGEGRMRDADVLPGAPASLASELYVVRQPSPPAYAALDWPVPGMSLRQLYDRLSEVQRGTVSGFIQGLLAADDDGARGKPKPAAG